MKMIELDLRPDLRRLRQFGWLAAGVFGVLAGWARWRGHVVGIDLGDSAVTVSLVFGTVAAVSGLFSLLWPLGNRLLYVAMSLVAWPIGTVVSYTMMVILFYLVITPVGLFFRLVGRDALNRRVDASLPSYWVEHRTPASVERYFRQF
jgi:hypothetical protein